MKYHGKIGFITYKESTPGVDIEVPIERDYTGDVIRNTKRWESGQRVNADLNINNQISIVADPFFRENLFAVRYLFWMRTFWEVTSVDVQYPRMILSIGGVYNGPTVGSSSTAGGSNGCGCNC